MPIEEAADFFAAVPAISRHLRTLSTSASATSASASRHRRCPAARRSGSSSPSELQKRSTGRTVYVLDEPTTGLHFEDIRKLLCVLGQPGRQGQHGARHRAQPRRHQDRRLGHRHGSRGRLPRRHGGRRGHARGGRGRTATATPATFLKPMLDGREAPAAQGRRKRVAAAPGAGQEGAGDAAARPRRGQEGRRPAAKTGRRPRKAPLRSGRRSTKGRWVAPGSRSVRWNGRRHLDEGDDPP